MDIHPPAGPVESAKDFLIHLSMIVIGILIAISLEQAVEWRHHRQLVREAEANILSEIRDNQEELEKILKTYPATDKNLRSAVEIATQYQRPGKHSGSSVELGLRIAQLSSASRSSAEATGALGFMDYQEVKRLVGVYDLQQQFLRIQDRLLDALTLAIGVYQPGPENASATQREQMIADGQLAISNLSVAASIGRGLSKAYEESLHPKR